ncbi:MAG: hypothetical protein CSA35_05340 [Dethiosulfovibrio peptidovorans]|nr:MAG: hypothetical protein CSA35_05340 [Dethiosulfovibrio peptidovorans]
MPQTMTKNATKTELYNRFGNLSDRDASRVLGYIDALEDEQDNRLADQVLAEGGAPISWEELKSELDTLHVIQD